MYLFYHVFLDVVLIMLYNFTMKKTQCCILIIIFVLLFLCSCTTVSSSVQNTSNEEINLTFSQLLEGKCFDKEGNVVTLNSDYYLVYYAANWCPYCKEFQEPLKETVKRFKRMYGNVQFIFAGHIRDLSDQDMLDFLEEGDYDFPYVPMQYREETGIMNLVDVPKFWIPGFVLLDKKGNVLSSSNGQTKEDYIRDKPLSYYETLQQCDCLQSI